MSFIVTGGHSPIAIAISRELSKRSKVFHLSRSTDSSLLRETQEYGNIILEEWDLGQTSDCLTKLKAKLDTEKIEGMVFAHRYREAEQDSLDQFIVEVQTPHSMIKFYSGYEANEGGSIVLITSPAAQYILPDQSFDYHASKAAITQLIRYAAINYVGAGNRFNGVSPGAFISKERSRGYYETHPERLNAIKEFVPLKRMGNVSEIASVVSFLCSEDSSYVNGEIINIDGGYTNMEPSFLL